MPDRRGRRGGPALRLREPGGEAAGRRLGRPRRPRRRPRYVPPEDPYPSTYRPYAGVPTAITGATIYDGEGGRIENGTIVMVEGRIQAVGGPDTPIPEGATRIDGRGRWVTPGVIDVHSHLGDYPSPGVEAH